MDREEKDYWRTRYDIFAKQISSVLQSEDKE